MSSVRRIGQVIVCVALVLPSNARAQHDEIAERRARIDSLLPEWRAANAAILRAHAEKDAARRARQIEVDTAQIGPFVVVAPKTQSREHFRNFRKAVAERGQMLEGIPSNRRMQLFVEHDGAANEGSIRFQAERSKGKFVRIFGNSPRVRRRHTRIEVDNALYNFIPSAVREWLGGSELGRGRERANVYREMATSRAASVRACHNGSLDDCTKALGFAGRSADAPAFSSTARASFLMHALQAGGKGSLARLDAAAGAPAMTAIERANGQRVSEVVRAWRNDIASDYVSYAGLLRGSAAVLLWTAIAGLLALRSTRRRAE